MRGRSGLNFALLAAVIALGLFAYYKPHKEEAAHQVSLQKAAEVSSIKVEVAGSPPVLLARAGTDWMLKTPITARADNSQVQRLLEILDARAKDRFPATGLARYDLNEPAARVTFNLQTFAFGAVNQMSREQYVLTQDGIYPLHVRYGSALPKHYLELVNRQLFSADEAPVAFTFTDFAVEQRNGKWQLTPPAADLSADDINRWTDEWRLAAALGLQHASNRKPLASIKVRLKTGREISVAVLQREPQLALARSDLQYEHLFSAEAAKRLLAPPAAAAVQKK
ncbi:MAG: DUF4340 domain-containing protein [Burkholderiales bacterium]